MLSRNVADVGAAAPCDASVRRVTRRHLLGPCVGPLIAVPSPHGELRCGGSITRRSQASSSDS